MIGIGMLETEKWVEYYRQKCQRQTHEWNIRGILGWVEDRWISETLETEM